MIIRTSILPRRMPDKFDRSLNSRRNVINFVLLLIVAIYEIKTEIFRNYFFSRNLEKPEKFEKLNSEENEEHSCDRKVKLAGYDQLPIVFLNSFPGSGNTWSRQLIEDTTGYYSGSTYSEGTMVQNGFLGEFDHPTSGTTIVVKNHGQNKMEYADGIILVVRNPYNAIIADFNRQTSHSHTGNTDYSKFSGPVWDHFVSQHGSRWGNTHLWYPAFAKKAEIPILVIYYEDLKEDVVPEMQKVLEFFKQNFEIQIPDEDWRLDCLIKHQAKFFRKKKPLEKELFSKAQIKEIDERVMQAQLMFDMYNLPPISDEYFKKKEKIRKISMSEVTEHINGSRIMGKINDRLEFREIYEKNKNSPHQYYAFNPFKY